MSFNNSVGIQINNAKSHRIFICKRVNYQVHYSCLLSIPISEHIKILGLYYSPDLSWTYHIDYTVNKICKYFYLIRIIKQFVHTDDMYVIFNSLVINTLCYGCEVYSHNLTYASKRKIKSFLNRFHHLLCTNFYTCTKDNCVYDIYSAWISRSFKLFKHALNNNNHMIHSIMPSFLPSGRRIMQPHSYHTRTSNTFLYKMTFFYNNTV